MSDEVRDARVRLLEAALHEYTENTGNNSEVQQELAHADYHRVLDLWCSPEHRDDLARVLDDEAMREYRALRDLGLSDSEARGTVWREQRVETERAKTERDEAMELADEAVALLRETAKYVPMFTRCNDPQCRDSTWDHDCEGTKNPLWAESRAFFARLDNYQSVPTFSKVGSKGRLDKENQ